MSIKISDEYCNRSAVISDDGKYRYTLRRATYRAVKLGSYAPIAVFIMFNPSVADDHVDDHTIRKCCGFASRWDIPCVEVVNLFAFRSTDPTQIPHGDGEAVGPLNDAEIKRALERSTRQRQGSVVIAAWGTLKHWMREPRIAQVRKLALDADVQLQCLSHTDGGDPRHPLMARYDRPPEPWLGWKGR